LNSCSRVLSDRLLTLAAGATRSRSVWKLVHRRVPPTLALAGNRQGPGCLPPLTSACPASLRLSQRRPTDAITATAGAAHAACQRCCSPCNHASAGESPRRAATHKLALNRPWAANPSYTALLWMLTLPLRGRRCQPEVCVCVCTCGLYCIAGVFQRLLACLKKCIQRPGPGRSARGARGE